MSDIKQYKIDMLYKSLGLIEVFINKLLKRSISNVVDPFKEYFDVYNYFRMSETQVLIVPSHTDQSGVNIHLISIVKTWLKFDLRYNI